MIHKQFEMVGIPDRPPKPRESGITLMLDKGLAARQVEDVLEVAAEYIDLVKLGWGTAVITPGLHRKLAIYRSAGVPAYFGGTLFEAFFLRDQIDTYRKLLSSLGLEHVEISDGTLRIPHEEKLRCIRSFGNEFRVLSEVGSKDSERVLPPYKWVQDIQEMVPLETLRLGLRADTLFEFLGAAEGVGRETFPPRPFLRPAFTEISGSESRASSLAGCKPEPG
jgi:phosphosulfolactate synthase